MDERTIDEMSLYIGALTILVGGLLALLDEKMPDFRKELRGAIERQQGGGGPSEEQIDLALNVIDGLRHFTRN